MAIPPITDTTELLDTDQILAAMSVPGRALLSELSLHSQIDSTNAEAMRRVEAGAGSGLVCTAEQQTAGRGRRGRQWISPYGSNLYLSLVWDFSAGAVALEGLSLAVGVAVTDALERMGIAGLSLKWPNDILCRDAKLGGVLIELAGDPGGVCSAIVGVGINLRMPAGEAAAIDQNWTDLTAVAGSAPPRNVLLAALLDELLTLLANFQALGFEPWRERWLQRDHYAGRELIIHSGDTQLAGTNAGISDNGSLLLKVGGLVQEVRGGEVSLRPQL